MVDAGIDDELAMAIALSLDPAAAAAAGAESVSPRGAAAAAGEAAAAAGAAGAASSPTAKKRRKSDEAAPVVLADDSELVLALPGESRFLRLAATQVRRRQLPPLSVEHGSSLSLISKARLACLGILGFLRGKSHAACTTALALPPPTGTAAPTSALALPRHYCRSHCHLSPRF